MTSANEALERLREGNRRFVDAQQDPNKRLDQSRRSELASGQSPFAIILGCSDSRVPSEIVFDQGLGDLFVIRVAGNIVDPALVGSIEYAAANCGSRLVVVLGHSKCGAVQATVDETKSPSGNLSPNLQAIVDGIRPCVDHLRQADDQQDRDTLVQKAVKANVAVSVDHLRNASEILRNLIRDQGLMVVGAEYSLDTGEVEFFDI